MRIKDPTSLIERFTEFADLKTGILKDAKVHLERKASVMPGYYADEQALEKLIKEQHDPLHYETFEGEVPPEYGQLLYGIRSRPKTLISDLTDCRQVYIMYWPQLARKAFLVVFLGEVASLAKQRGRSKSSSRPDKRPPDAGLEVLACLWRGRPYSR